MTIKKSKAKMETPKLRIVFHEHENKVQSYFHLEKTEAIRVIQILNILPGLKEWTPVSTVSEMINAKIPAVLWTVQKLAGALHIDIKLPSGNRKIIAKRPVLLIRKKQFNTRNNLRKQKYLRPTVYIKAYIGKDGGVLVQ